MNTLIDFARSRGKKVMYSMDLSDNTQMHQLANDLSMTTKHDPDDASMVRYELTL
jgi:hypothetical protein